jgi:thiol-disulfide isomerase/thioredoxin
MTVGSSFAYDEKPFTDAAFKAVQQAGKPILIDAYAPWCPVCRAQQKVLGELKQNAKYDGVTVLKIDYDNQADALKAFGVRRQSTLIAYKGDKETGRSVGDTNAGSIAALLDSALK